MNSISKMKVAREGKMVLHGEGVIHIKLLKSKAS